MKTRPSYRHLLSAIGTTLALLLISALYVTPAKNTVNIGAFYEPLSQAPFNFASNNVFQLRVLTPLLAYLLGFRGNLYMYFPWLINIVWLITIIFYFGKKFRPPISTIAAALMVFSTPILFLLHFQGYVDNITYFLIWLAYIYSASYWSPIIYGLCIFNHPFSYFMIPWIIWTWAVKRRSNREFGLKLSLLAICIVAYVAWSQCAVHHSHIIFDNSFYFHASYIRETVFYQLRFGWLGIFMAFKLFWVLPIGAAYLLWTEKRFSDIVSLLLPFVMTCVVFLFSSDTSRYFGLAYPAILLGFEHLASWAKTHGELDRFQKCMIWLVMLNFLIPEYYIGQFNVIPFFPVPVYLYFKRLGVINARSWIH